MSCWPRGGSRLDALPNKFQKILARVIEIIFRRNGFAKMDDDFAQTGNWMEVSRLGRDKLHVRNEHGHDRHFGFLGDVINARLARRDANAISARAFRVNYEIEVSSGTAKGGEFLDAARIEPAAVQKKSNAAAERSLDP